MSKLREAAIAVYDRWDSPLWKDLPATARYMHDLRNALDEPDRMEAEYTAATLRIDNDLMVIDALTKERDEYKQRMQRLMTTVSQLTASRDAYAAAADSMAASHKVERDGLLALHTEQINYTVKTVAERDALKDAAKLALVALNGVVDFDPDKRAQWSVSGGSIEAHECNAAITALKAVEPVAWAITASNTGRMCQVTLDHDEVAEMNSKYVTPLYLHPPQQQAVTPVPELLEELENCRDLLKIAFPDAPVDSCIGVGIIKASAAIAAAQGEKP